MEPRRQSRFTSFATQTLGKESPLHVGNIHLCLPVLDVEKPTRKRNGNHLAWTSAFKTAAGRSWRGLPACFRIYIRNPRPARANSGGRNRWIDVECGRREAGPFLARVGGPHPRNAQFPPERKRVTFAENTSSKDPAGKCLKGWAAMGRVSVIGELDPRSKERGFFDSLFLPQSIVHARRRFSWTGKTRNFSRDRMRLGFKWLGIAHDHGRMERTDFGPGERAIMGYVSRAELLWFKASPHV